MCTCLKLIKRIILKVCSYLMASFGIFVDLARPKIYLHKQMAILMSSRDWFDRFWKRN